MSALNPYPYHACTLTTKTPLPRSVLRRRLPYRAMPGHVLPMHYRIRSRKPLVPLLGLWDSVAECGFVHLTCGRFVDVVDLFGYLPFFNLFPKTLLPASFLPPLNSTRTPTPPLNETKQPDFIKPPVWFRLEPTTHIARLHEIHLCWLPRVTGATSTLVPRQAQDKRRPRSTSSLGRAAVTKQPPQCSFLSVCALSAR